MAENRYRFFLQNSGELEQTVVTIKNGEAHLTRVPQLSLITAKDLRKKETPASTLAYFDAMTCEARDIVEFLDAFRVPLYRYNLQKTHIGYFYDSRLRRLKPVTNDETLQRIAMKADGIEIYNNDSDAYSFIYDFIEKLEEDGSDFVPQLVKAAKKSDGFKSFDYSIPEHLLNYIVEYHNGKISNSRGYYFSLALDADLREAKSDIIKSLKSYKNFREIYRFTKAFDLGQFTKTDSPIRSVQSIEESKEPQKSIGPKPVQLTLFDYLDSQK